METLAPFILAATFCGTSTQAANVEGAFLVGPPASDVLGSEDLWGNPTFVGGVANRLFARLYLRRFGLMIEVPYPKDPDSA